MQRSSYKLLFVGVALLMLTGCAFTTTTIPLNYYPAPTGADLKSRNSLTIGEFKDARSDAASPDFLVNKSDGHGNATTGTFVAEQPLTEIIQTALNEALSSDGLRVLPSNGNMKLTGQLLNLTMRRRVGFFSSELDCGIQVNFKLINNRTGEQVWDDVMNGKGASKNIHFLYSDDIKIAFKNAADNLIFNLENSSDFRRALNR